MRIFGFHRQYSFLLKMVVAMVLVALGDWMFFQHQKFGGYLGLYGLVLLAGMIGARRDVRADRRAWIAAAMAGLFALAMVYDASLLSWTLFWIAAAMAALLPHSGRFDDGWRWFQRLVAHGLRAPFAPLLDFIRVQKAQRKRRPGGFDFRSRLPVLVVPLLGSAVFLTLFAAANPVLEQLLASIGTPDISIVDIFRAMFWGILLITAWSLIHPRLVRWTFSSFDGSGDLPIPGVSVASIKLSLIMFNLLFALQNLMDFAYLGGVVAMPSDITLAEYAHRGAYPLIVTALLAGLFVVVTLRPGSVTALDGTIRKLVTLWIGQNIVLVGSSILRTLDYVEAYSLTILRISALAWMALVAVGLLLICWRMLAGKSASWLINTNLVAAAVVLTAASFVDLGNVAASWNVRHAKEAGGQGAELDLCYLERLGQSSLLPLLELEARTDLPQQFRERVHATRLNVHRVWQPEGYWTLLHASRMKQAEAMIAELDPVELEPGVRLCGGAIRPPLPPEQPRDDPKAYPVDDMPVDPSPSDNEAPRETSALTAEPR